MFIRSSLLSLLLFFQDWVSLEGVDCVWSVLFSVPPSSPLSSWVLFFPDVVPTSAFFSTHHLVPPSLKISSSLYTPLWRWVKSSHSCWSLWLSIIKNSYQDFLSVKPLSLLFLSTVWKSFLAQVPAELVSCQANKRGTPSSVPSKASWWWLASCSPCHPPNSFSLLMVHLLLSHASTASPADTSFSPPFRFKYFSFHLHHREQIPTKVTLRLLPTIEVISCLLCPVPRWDSPRPFISKR